MSGSLPKARSIAHREERWRPEPEVAGTIGRGIRKEDVVNDSQVPDGELPLVREQMNRLFTNIQYNREAINSLRQRLEYVLSAGPRPDDEEHAPRKCYSVPLVDELDTANNILIACNSEIYSIIKDLGV